MMAPSTRLAAGQCGARYHKGRPARVNDSTCMWTASHTSLGDDEVLKAEFHFQNTALTVGDVISGWKNSEQFRSFFIAELASSPFKAFFWETPPIRGKGLKEKYEHVVVRSDLLGETVADPRAFESEFRRIGGQPVATFRNLGGDALLIAPRGVADKAAYGHLATFLRLAPPAQQHALYEALGAAVARELARTSNPIWISTSGLGVPWLHIRLDARPKYYSYTPYRIA